MSKRSIIAALLASTLVLLPSMASAKNNGNNGNGAGNGNANSNGNGNGNGGGGGGSGGSTTTPPNPPPAPTIAVACAISDLQAATACSGYYAGNLNGAGNDKIADSQFALAQLGFNWDGVTILSKIEAFQGNTIDFGLANPIFGTSFVSIHYGAGQGPAKTQGGTTGFYKVESPVALQFLATTFGSLSNAVLYSRTGTDPRGGGGGGGSVDPVPEPAVWMQLIAGFGLVGLARRGRKAAIA
jgi:hypothetical protein